MALGGSQTVRSFISLPRKMMYSNTSSRGGIGLSVGRSSVPKERTVQKVRDHLKQTSKDTFIQDKLQSTLFTNTLTMV